MTPWLATFTRRWHSNPDLCHTVDPVGAHSGRMGVLALQIWGGGASRDLLAACLCHDLGESVTGDIPASAKCNPRLAGPLGVAEDRALAEMGMAYDLSTDDARRLKFLDRLDAYYWARHHAPHVLARDDWPKALAWLQREADDLQAEVGL
jgi:hypothetical protein